MSEDNRMTIENFDPTFLFCWKGTRTQDEPNYHSHDYLEVCFVLSGTGKYRIDDVIYDVQEGDLLIFNPGVWHQALLGEEGEQGTTEFFIGCNDFQLKNEAPNYMVLPGGSNILHTTGDLRQRLFRICSSMEVERTASKVGRYFMLKTYMMQILLLMIREQCEPPEHASGYAFESVNKKYVVEQIVNYFEDHYSEKISLDRIAENMYLSTFYISKIFKSETGDTPIRHLINIRLQKAKELFDQGHGGSIQEIASMVGYEDAYHFSKLFKKYYGITPSQARKKESV